MSTKSYRVVKTITFAAVKRNPGEIVSNIPEERAKAWVGDGSLEPVEQPQKTKGDKE